MKKNGTLEDVEVRLESRRERHHRAALGDEQVVVLTLDVGDRPIAALEHLQPHAFIDSTFRPGGRRGEEKRGKSGETAKARHGGRILRSIN
jgi:hypothetical protein